ncbi:MAG: MBL fold metallo-hydrolase [Eubacteriales bacterium]|nr:MBL fold metallo-hydrolase [Eubacteriales bacterium]MDD3350354.1 MBL fold metallo-hydrolase [Eubacteriales bacterium]
MSFSFCSFASGSTGNCYLVRSGETALLVDAGISAKKILEGLAHTGTTEEQLKGLLLTHEHSDHIRSLKTLSKKRASMDVYANEGTWGAIETEIHPERKKHFQNGEAFQIGKILVKAFSVSHDAADPVGYSFYSEGKQVSIVTDTGYIPEEVYDEVLDADLLILEANHDVNMLKIGRYPWFLKQRILGTTGHLSNETAAHTLVRLFSERQKERKILLAHLSRENNFPEMAYQTVKNILEEENYALGKQILLSTIVRDEISAVFQV